VGGLFAAVEGWRAAESGCRLTVPCLVAGGRFEC